MRRALLEAVGAKIITTPGDIAHYVGCTLFGIQVGDEMMIPLMAAE
jgi:hypothetical protein